jgi:hypothetical protein
MLLLAFILLSISGCAMFTREPDFPWSADKLPCYAATTNATCSAKDALEAYTLARAYCHKLSRSYEDGGDFINSSSFAIGGIGTLAGAVFSPLAGGGAKTAWSGLSGSANALQTALNTNFSNAVNARRRAEIGNSGAAARDQVSREKKDPTMQVFAAIDMAYDCKMAIGRADVAAIQALNEIQTGAGKPKENPSATVNPEETRAEAGEKAEEAAKPAAVSATNVPIAVTATRDEIKTIKELRGQVAEAAAVAAASAAASTATDTAQSVAAIAGESPSLMQIQATAKVAAEATANQAAKAAAEAKAEQILKGRSSEIHRAVMESTAPAAAAAARAAADAAAGAAAAPAQPVSSP